MNKNNIIIKTFRLGCKNEEIFLEEGCSIKEFRKIEKLSGSVKIYKEIKGNVLEVNDDYILISGDSLFLVNKMSGAAIFKRLGRVWSIHYNDPDPFPSNFHVHDKENGDKLDLYTGNKYNKLRQFIRKIKKKELIGLLKELSRKNCYKDKADEILKSIRDDKTI